MKIQTATTPTPSSQTPQNQLQGTQDEFLKLFMAQMQNQDPLDPSSGSDMVAQLAQFSSVEQQAQTNQQLQDLVAAQASNASASLSSLVGRQCDATATDFTIDAAGGAPPPLSLTSSSSMKGASVVITDDNGKEVRRLSAPDAKSATLAWDGKDASGNPVPPGNYHISIDGGTSPVTATWHGRVDAVELTPDGPRLRMGDVLITPASITTIGATTNTINALGALS
jgi:flagellar basal-body rod modification protein FlgD